MSKGADGTVKSPETRLSRRDFLKGTAAAAALTTVNWGWHIQGAEVAEEAPPIKLGIIGAGSQGRGALMASALKIPGAQFTAVCDIRPDNLQAALEMAGPGAQGFVEYRELLEKSDVEAVIVATPLHLHAPITIAAFQAGKHVFCEKAMAYTVDECKEMLRAQRRAGKILQVGHHLRYHPLYHHAKEQIEKGLLGKITNVRAQWNRHGSWRRPVPKGDFDFRPWGYPTPDHLFNWRLYKETSGGLMAELGSHQTDVIYWMLGLSPTAVIGVGGIDYYQDGRTVFDNVHVIYECPNGIKFSYESLTANAHSPYGEAYEMIQGDKGTFILSNVPRSRGLFFLEPGAEKEDWLEVAHKEKVDGKEAITLDAAATKGKDKPKIPGQDVSIAETTKNTYQMELEDFIACIRTGREPFCNGEIGLRSAAAALLANQAMEHQERIEFKESLYEV